MKKTIAIVVTVIGVLLLGVAAVMLILGNKDNNSSNNKKEEKKESKKETAEKEEVKLGSYTGIYKSGNATLKVVQTDKQISFKYDYKYESNSYNSIDSYIEGKGPEYKSDNITIKFEDGKAVVKGNDNKVKDGDYTKSEYTTDQIYEDFIGEVKYADSKYNAIYKCDGYKLITLKVASNELRIIFERESVDITIKKTDDKTKQEFVEKFFDTTYTLLFTDDEKTVKVTVEDPDNPKSEISGTYTREKLLSKEAIINMLLVD